LQFLQAVQVGAAVLARVRSLHLIDQLDLAAAGNGNGTWSNEHADLSGSGKENVWIASSLGFVYRYLLVHEVDGSDRENLIDSLEDEDFPIREHLGRLRVMKRPDPRRRAALRPSERQSPALVGEAVRTLSVYLSEYIIGLEVAEGRNAAASRVRVDIRKHVGAHGRSGGGVAASQESSSPPETISPGDEDRGGAYPAWAELTRAASRFCSDAARLENSLPALA